MSVRIKQGKVYAWDPSREDPHNPLALVAVSTDTFEVRGVDDAVPQLRYGRDWTAKYGMLGVEMRGEHLSQYEGAVLAGGTEWHVWAEEAEGFGLEALEALSRHGEFVDWPPSSSGMRLVTFRSAELLQSYGGWLWSKSPGDLFTM